MDNTNFQPFQSGQQPTVAGPLPQVNPQVRIGGTQIAGGNPTMMGATPQMGGGNPAMGAGVPVMAKKKNTDLVKTIVIVALSLVAATFIGLFIWMFIMWDEASTDLDGQIKQAVAIAVDERETVLENQFTEREKYPYKIFAGPAD